MYGNYQGAQMYGAPYGQQPMPGQQFYNGQLMGYNPNYYDPATMYGYPQGSGVIVNPCNVKGISTTSKEDDELLRNSGTKEFQITPLAMAIARCNHKDEHGNIKVEIIDSETNYFKCTKCGKKFHLIRPTEEEVKDVVNMFLDLFQSIKTSWLTPPKEFAEQVYTIQCLIEMVPDMYKAAQRDWKAGLKAINNQVQAANGGSYWNNGLNAVPHIQEGFYQGYQGGGYAGYNNGYPQQPQMYPPQQPGGYQFMQPGQGMGGGYYNQQMQQPTPMGGNMMRSEFVQGGVVPPVPQQNPAPIPNFMQMQQPMPGQPQQQPIPQMQQQPVANPQQQSTAPNMVLPQNHQQPGQVTTNPGTSTATVSL